MVELRSRRRAIKGRWAAASLAAFAASLAFMEAEWPGAALLMLVAGLAASAEGRRRLLAIDASLAMAELLEMAAKEEEERAEQQVERERAAQESIAGIVFDTPAGVFEGRTVFRFASKDGRRYEYAGIADPSDEPSRSLLIVNGLSYRLMEPA